MLMLAMTGWLLAATTIPIYSRLDRIEFGDPTTGVIVAVSVSGADQLLGAPQGSLFIAPRTKNPRREPKLLADVMASEKGDPPRRHVQRYEVQVDGQAYESTRVHPWGMPIYTTALPYAPKAVTVRAWFSTGESYSGTLQMPDGFPLDHHIDLREQEVAKISDLYGEAKAHQSKAFPTSVIAAPYRNKTTYWVNDPWGGGMKLYVQAACMGSREKGRVVQTSLIIKRHYFYSPDGNTTLWSTRFHQPVYGTDQSINFSLPFYVVFNPVGYRAVRTRRPDDIGSDPNNKYPAQFVFECRTESGEVMRSEFEFRYEKAWE